MAFTAVNLKPADSKDAVTFTIKNFGINTHGSLSGLKGVINWDADNFSNSTFNVSVDVATINTGIDDRDNHLRREEYFDAGKYPTITFISNQIMKSAQGEWTLTADLTIKGVTKTLTIPFTAVKSGNGYLFEGNFSINRKDFGVGGNSMVLGDEIKVKLKVQANPSS